MGVWRSGQGCGLGLNALQVSGFEPRYRFFVWRCPNFIILELISPPRPPACGQSLAGAVALVERIELMELMELTGLMELMECADPAFTWKYGASSKGLECL